MGKTLIIKDADFSAVSCDNLNKYLPDGYKRVSKIFNTTSSPEDPTSLSFDTGIYVTPEYSIRCHGAFIGTTVNWAGFFDDYVDEQTIVTRVIRRRLNNQNLTFCIAILPTNLTNVITAIDTSLPNVYEIKGKTKNLFINDVLVATQATEPSTLPKTNTMTIALADVAICGKFIIKNENDIPVFYGIPCVRESDDFAGIYDTISGSFISNGFKNEYEE